MTCCEAINLLLCILHSAFEPQQYTYIANYNVAATKENRIWKTILHTCIHNFEYASFNYIYGIPRKYGAVSMQFSINLQLHNYSKSFSGPTQPTLHYHKGIVDI